MDSERDNLDRLIDGALASYSSAEPLAGLEARVLNRVRAARSSTRRMFAWAAVLATVASLVAVGMLIRTQPRPAAKAHVSAPEVARVTNAPPPTALTKPEPRIRRAARTGRPKALPKLDQFPALTPLTAEERALIALAEHDPKEIQMFADLQKRAEEPIEIQEIQIAPLRNDGVE